MFFWGSALAAASAWVRSGKASQRAGGRRATPAQGKALPGGLSPGRQKWGKAQRLAIFALTTGANCG